MFTHAFFFLNCCEENKWLPDCLSGHPAPTVHPSSAPSFGQLGTEFIRFVLLLFFLQTASPPPPPFPSPPHCRNRICRNHSKARYNLLLAVHNTPSLSPLSQLHKVPCGWTNHTWNIISASYSSILWTAPFLWCNRFNPCLVTLVPAFAGGKATSMGGRAFVFLFFVVYCLLCIFPPSFSFLLSEIKH